MPTALTVQLNYISDIHLEWLFDKRGLLETDVLDEIYRPPCSAATGSLQRNTIC